MEFHLIFDKVVAIVYKTRQEFYLQLWDKSDWEQEGRMVLYKLLQAFPGIESDEAKLFTYFKTKFRNYVIDVLREQESYKRRLNRLPYEEISEVGHRLVLKEMASSDMVILRGMLADYRASLSPDKQAKYDRLIGGETFLGRKEMLRDLEIYLKDFGQEALL